MHRPLTPEAATIWQARYGGFHRTHDTLTAVADWALYLASRYSIEDEAVLVLAGYGNAHCAIYSGPTYELPADDLRIGMSGAGVRALLTVYVEPVRVDPISDADLAAFTLRAPALLQGAA